MAWWNGPAIIAIGMLPVTLVAWWVGHWGLAAGTLVSFSSYYGAYEYMHWCMHLPKQRRIERSALFRRLNGHHLLHHRYMHKNFNVVLPLADQAQVQEPEPGSRFVKLNVKLTDPESGSGEVRVAGQKQDLPQLTRLLKLEVETFGKKEPNPKDPSKMDSLLDVVVRADQGVNAKYLHQIYRACSDAKIFKLWIASLNERLEPAYEDVE